MKKLLAITLAAILGLMLSGCKKVEPTSLSYMYSVKVKGIVYFDDNGNQGNPASNITVTITATNSPKTTYKAVTGSDGKFSMLLPNKTKEANTITLYVTESQRGDGKKYSSKENKSVTLDAGATSEEIVVQLKAGENI